LLQISSAYNTSLEREPEPVSALCLQSQSAGFQLKLNCAADRITDNDRLT